MEQCYFTSPFVTFLTISYRFKRLTDQEGLQNYSFKLFTVLLKNYWFFNRLTALIYIFLVAGGAEIFYFFKSLHIWTHWRVSRIRLPQILSQTLLKLFQNFSQLYIWCIFTRIFCNAPSIFRGNLQTQILLTSVSVWSIDPFFHIRFWLKVPFFVE